MVRSFGSLFLASLAFFWIFRLFNLTVLPIFADEAIYLRWAQVMRAEPTLRFLPLSDGKQPLYMWLVMVALRFNLDPLVIGRLVSVTAGFGTWLGVMFVTWLVAHEKRAAIFAGWLYAIVPYFVFYDRLALVDSLLAMLTVWFVSLSLILIRRPRLGVSLVAGGVLGAALVTKSPAVFAALVWPVGILVIGQKKIELGKLVKLVFFGVLMVLVGFGIYNLLRLGPEFQMIKIRNQDYVFSWREVLSHPTDPLRPHFNDLADWLPNLLTLPVFLAWWGGWLKWVKEKRWGLVIFTFALSLVPILAQASIAKVFTPRYLLFAIWPLLIPASSLLAGLTRKRFFWLTVIIVSVLPFLYNHRLLINPGLANLPRKLRSGYLEEWTAGQGIRESAVYLQDRAEKSGRPILVGTEGYFGTLPDGLQLYFDREPRVIIIGVGQPVRQIPESLINALAENEVYLVVNKSRFLILGEWKSGREYADLSYFETEKYILVETGAYPKETGPEGQDQLLFLELREKRG